MLNAQHTDRIETVLTTGHDLVSFGIDYLLAQGLDVPRETLERVIRINNDRPIRVDGDGYDALHIQFHDVDHHDDEALNELYYDRLQALTAPRHKYDNRIDRLRDYFRDAVRAKYGGHTVTFARGPYYFGRYHVYVIIDHRELDPEWAS